MRGKTKPANKQKEDPVPTDTLLMLRHKGLIYNSVFWSHFDFFVPKWIHLPPLFNLLTDCATVLLINAGRGNVWWWWGGQMGANSISPVTPPSTFLPSSVFSFNLPLLKGTQNFSSSSDKM